MFPLITCINKKLSERVQKFTIIPSQEIVVLSFRPMVKKVLSVKMNLSPFLNPW
jgi:phosphopantetheine adenylyltransferase